MVQGLPRQRRKQLAEQANNFLDDEHVYQSTPHARYLSENASHCVRSSTSTAPRRPTRWACIAGKDDGVEATWPVVFL